MCIVIQIKCKNKPTDRSLAAIEKLNSEYYYLDKDVNGVPNSDGLILLHSKNDSIKVDPIQIEQLDLTPNWERDTFPYEVFNFPNLKSLYVGMRSFEILPSEISKLKHLESIDLQNSNLKYLPKNIGNLSELREIVLLGSNVETLPISICELQKLKRLQLGNSKVKLLPECIKNLSQLEEIIIGVEDVSLSLELKRQIIRLKTEMPNCKFVTSEDYMN